MWKGLLRSDGSRIRKLMCRLMEPLTRPISGKHVVPRVSPRDRDRIVDDQEPIHTECGATVPASPGALISANRFCHLAIESDSESSTEEIHVPQRHRGSCWCHRTSQRPMPRFLNVPLLSAAVEDDRLCPFNQWLREKGHKAKFGDSFS